MNEASSLAAIVRQVNRLKQLNDSVKRLLPEKLRQHCQVANLDKGRLLLEVDNNSWGSQLYYAKPELLQKLRQNPEFAGLIGIEHRVNPALRTDHNKSQRALRPPVKLSLDNLQQLAQLATSTENEQLKNSLLKLLEHQQKK